MRKIYSDALIDFGKYKGKPATDTTHSDPGYFVWLVATGVAELDDELTKIITLWSLRNPKLAEKQRDAGEVSRKQKADKERVNVSLGGDVSAQLAQVPKVSTEVRPDWGTW
ncbi:hypothetical protein [Methyloversatilis sp.]|uniref:hypothetical protein n=1 Tax=Methyloversatilis sp. TaxID=2569862 RepID=UPI0035ADC928